MSVRGWKGGFVIDSPLRQNIVSDVIVVIFELNTPSVRPVVSVPLSPSRRRRRRHLSVRPSVRPVIRTVVAVVRPLSVQNLKLHTLKSLR